MRENHLTREKATRRGVIFTRPSVLLPLLSLRKNGGLLVVYRHLATNKSTHRQPTRHHEVQSQPSNDSALSDVFTHLGFLT